MKRSEMIDRISWMLSQHHPVGRGDKECSESILCDLESEGMLPPAITIMPDSYDRDNGSYGFQVNEWEPEDEKK